MAKWRIDMSKLTKNSLEQSLKNLLKTKPLNRITINDLVDYYGRISPPFHVMGPSIHRTSPLDNIRRIGPYPIH